MKVAGGRYLFHLLGLLCLTLLAYSNTFEVPFQMDDGMFIRDNPIVRQTGYFLSPSDADKYPQYNLFIHRYLGVFTFAMNYMFCDLCPTGYHMVNLSIHMINALLVYWLVRLTFRSPGMFGSELEGSAHPIALMSAMLFALHPVQTEGVTYIFQRFASLCTMFYMLSLGAYVMWRTARPGAQWWYAASLGAAAAAMFTKETAFTLPAAIVLYEYVFFGGRKFARFTRILPYALTLPIIPLLHAQPSDTIIGLLKNTWDMTANMFLLPRPDYLFTEIPVLVTYLRLIFLPIGQNVDYDYPAHHSLLDLRVGSALVFLLGLLALGVWCIRKARRGGEPALTLVGFGILWFFLTISVESTIIPIPMVINEYRLYLPSGFVFAAIVIAGAMVFRRIDLGLSVWGSAAAFLILPVLAGSATYARNAVWQDTVTLWEDAVGKSPSRARCHGFLALAYMERGDYGRAVAEYQKAIELDPLDSWARSNLGTAYLKTGRAAEAITEYRRAATLKPEFFEPRFNLAGVYFKLGRLDEAVVRYKEAFRLEPWNSEVLFQIAKTYFKRGDFDLACNAFRQTLSLNPGHAEARYMLTSLCGTGSVAQAYPALP